MPAKINKQENQSKTIKKADSIKKEQPKNKVVSIDKKQVGKDLKNIKESKKQIKEVKQIKQSKETKEVKDNKSKGMIKSAEKKESLSPSKQGKGFEKKQNKIETKQLKGQVKKQIAKIDNKKDNKKQSKNQIKNQSKLQSKNQNKFQSKNQNKKNTDRNSKQVKAVQKSTKDLKGVDKNKEKSPQVTKRKQIQKGKDSKASGIIAKPDKVAQKVPIKQENMKEDKKTKKNKDKQLLPPPPVRQQEDLIKQTGLLEAYQLFLRAICRHGLPSGDVYQFAAQQIEKYERKKISRELKLKAEMQIQKAARKREEKTLSNDG